jgi:hypothetical protein
MVRNLMMIIGLSLAVAAFGCDSDSTSGTGGTGGTAGGGGAGGGGGSSTGPTDQCTNADDLPTVCDEAGLQEDIRVCATAAVGQGDATSACLQLEPASLTEGCADCYGGVTQCIFDNCIGECAVDPSVQACVDCQAANGCDTALNSCTGDLGAACDGGGGGAGGDGGGGAGGDPS